MKAKKRFLVQRDAWKKGDFGTVRKLADEAREELKEEGFVRREPLFGWIEKEWFDKAVKMGAVSKGAGGWAICVGEIETEKKGGRKKRKVRKTVFPKWKKWSKAYEKYKKQEYAREANWKGIMASEKYEQTTNSA